MNFTTSLLENPALPTPLHMMTNSCPPLPSGSYSECQRAVEKISQEVQQLFIYWFGSIKSYCELPELNLTHLQRSIGDVFDTSNFEILTSQDLCGPVARGMDSLERPFIAFNIGHHVVDPKTGEAQVEFNDSQAYILHQSSTAEPQLWTSRLATKRKISMIPLMDQAEVKLYDAAGNYTKLALDIHQLVKKGFIDQGYQINLNGITYGFHIQFTRNLSRFYEDEYI